MSYLEFNYLEFNITSVLAAVIFVIAIVIARKVRQPAIITNTRVKMTASHRHRSVSIGQQSAAIYSVARYNFGFFLTILAMFTLNYALAPFASMFCVPSNPSMGAGLVVGAILNAVMLMISQISMTTKFQRDNAGLMEKNMSMLAKVATTFVLCFGVYMLGMSTMNC